MSGAHVARVHWARDGDFAAGAYSRVHTIAFDGGAELRGSASPAVVPAPWSDAAAVDPEEMLVAAVAACHMLWLLDLARRAGFVIESYDDDALGTMARDDRGRMAITQVKLSPAIVFAGDGPDPAAIASLHRKAHEACFIANSLRGEVIVVPR